MVAVDNRTQSNKRVIYIVGPQSLQNELASYYMERELGAKCMVYENLRQVPVLDNGITDGQIHLILWDSQGKDPEELLVELEFYGEEILSRVY